MSNYTISKRVSANIPRSIEIDGQKENLDNFIEKSWLKNYNLKEENKKKLIEKIVICLSLVCHSSCRVIKEFIKIVFDYDISIGTISNILNRAGEKAKIFNENQDVSKIKEGALDEIFSNNIPSLVGVDLRSSYIFLLEEGCGRSGDDWGLALLEKQEKQGLELIYAVMDQALGMHKGVKEVYRDAIIQSDFFHTIREIFKVLKKLENKAYKEIKKFYEIEDRFLKALLKKQGQKYGRKYKLVQSEMEEAISLYDDFWILTQWFYELMDIYSESYEKRVWIYDYVLDEIKKRSENKLDIKALVKYLKNNKEKLLSFARVLDEKLIKFKEDNHYDLNIDDIKIRYRQLTFGEEHCKYWILEGKLLSKFAKDLKPIQTQVKALLDNTFRASSIVENVNSLIRPYFSLRKTIGRSNFLNLLQFYFNTKTIERCDKFPDRVGKSRLQVFTGKKHLTWLQLIGY